MKFKVDENLPQEIVDLLRRSGHDASSAEDEGLGGADDSRISSVLKVEGRALVTLDRGFADIREYPPEDFSGLIVLRVAWQDKQHVLDVVTRLIPLLDATPLDRRLWTVEEKGLAYVEG
ncbi:MAG: DUF5615 family PIN-like protein [Planctomycetota bacterium]